MTEVAQKMVENSQNTTLEAFWGQTKQIRFHIMFRIINIKLVGTKFFFYEINIIGEIEIKVHAVKPIFDSPNFKGVSRGILG